LLIFEYTTASFPIAGTFTIARGSKTSADVIVVKVTDGQHQGQGEAVPYARYGETVAQCLASLESGDHSNLPRAAANALDCAMWDLRAKQSGKPAWELAGLLQPKSQITAYTLSLDTPEAMAQAAANAAHMPLLKLKLGRQGDEQRLKLIRQAVPKARLIVDANEGWTNDNIEAMLQHCAEHGIELVEQPLPAGQDDILKTIRHTTLICADESAHDAASLPSLKGKYDAVNIKLDKTGGLTGALEMAKAAKFQDFKIMVGCMLASSLAMAPAFLVAQLADYVDLDGPLLLAKDRTPAITYINGVMQMPPRELWG
jgi:L-Ala-D/L-Glu epimerase